MRPSETTAVASMKVSPGPRVKMPPTKLFRCQGKYRHELLARLTVCQVPWGDNAILCGILAHGGYLKQCQLELETL